MPVCGIASNDKLPQHAGICGAGRNKIRCGFNTRAPSTALRRSLNHADRDARHRCHGGQAGHADGVPTNNRSATRPDPALSACVQKSKAAMESLGNTGPSASDLGQVLSVTPSVTQEEGLRRQILQRVNVVHTCKPAHRRVNEMQPSQSAAAKAAPKSGTVTSGQNPVTFCGPRAQAEEYPRRGAGAVIARSPGNRHLHRQDLRLLGCRAVRCGRCTDVPAGWVCGHLQQFRSGTAHNAARAAGPVGLNAS